MAYLTNLIINKIKKALLHDVVHEFINGVH
jgi:hypothetical protein